MLARWAAFLALTACVDSSSVRCPDGSVCPDGTTCATVASETLCVRPDQIASCAGKLELDECGTNQRCYDGVCLTAGCGNGRVDPDEACDDKNTVPNDGCSADCRSDETCGNGVVDFVKAEQCDDGATARALSHDGCASDCTVETARWLLVPPLNEIDGAIAYDASRDRVVLFGDFRSEAQTWEWDGARWLIQTPRVSPVRRVNHAMAYDPIRKRVVLFGGSSFNDTWEWDGSTWTLRAPAMSPPARNGHAMAFDPRRKRIVMFGGADAQGFGALGDTWAWDGDNWTPIASAESPSPRQRMAMAYDPKRDVIVLFGGFLASNVTNDETWELGASGWTRRLPATVPPPRSNHGMGFDLRSGQIIVHGGASGITRTDTWLWNGTDWAQHPTAGPALTGNTRMTTALEDGTPIILDDGRTFRWDAGWTLLEDSVQSIPARAFAAGAADVAGRRLLVHGGIETTTVQTTLIWSGTWARLPNTTTPGPGRVSSSAMTYDAARGEFVHFGGADFNTNADSNETWVFKTGWTKKTPTTNPPAVSGHMLAFDAARARVVLFGGPTDVTYLWDGTDWNLAQPATKPPARFEGAFAYDPIREVVVLFGGFAGATTFGDTWEWNGTTWTQRMIAGPPPRSGAGLAWDAARKRLVLFGGANQAQTLTDQWEYDGQSWTQVPVLATVKGRSNHVMGSALDGAGVLAFGGAGEGNQFADLLRLRWENDAADELCHATDGDGDALAGCADADCWRVCKPDCPPGMSCMSTRGCGDGTCDRTTESCTTCAMDCACPARCGDLVCDAGETAASCPGDCP